MKRNRITVVIGALLILIFALLLFVFQVRTTQVAVVATFGNPTRTVSNPGAYLKWPWPIQKVYYMDNRIQSFEDKFTEDYTKDNNTLLTSVYIGWRITDPKEFLLKFKDGSVAVAEGNLGGFVHNAKTATVGSHALADFVSVSGSGTNFLAIEHEMLEAIRTRVQTNNYGIEIDFLGLKKLGFPASVTQDVFSQMTSERQVLIEKLQREGEAQAQIIRSGADRRAAEMIAVAQGQATKIQGEGEVEAAKYLSAFRQNPELAGFLFRLTALESSLKERSTLILDQQNQPFDLFGGFTTNLMSK
jgi:membrane protease subunit HflC